LDGLVQLQETRLGLEKNFKFGYFSGILAGFETEAANIFSVKPRVKKYCTKLKIIHLTRCGIIRLY